MQTSGRLSNVAPPCILRKNPPSARNGGHETDAQILELNQQVSGVDTGSRESPATKARPPGRQGGKGVRGGGLWLEHHLLPEQLLDLKLTVDGLEKERDFYFSKLRDIELICQEHESENSPVISGIIGILYATEVSPASAC